jgi:hypothetical protein
MACCLAAGAACPSTSRHITRASANGPRGKRVPAASTLAASTPTTATSTPTPLAPRPTSVAVGKEVEESAMWAQIAVHEEWEKRGGAAAAAASSSGRSWQGPELLQAYERCAAAMHREGAAVQHPWHAVCPGWRCLHGPHLAPLSAPPAPAPAQPLPPPLSSTSGAATPLPPHPPIALLTPLSALLLLLLLGAGVGR